MKLGKYLTANHITEAEFAKLIGATESAVKKWKRGERTPRPSHMHKIVAATCGDVSPNDFLTPPAPRIDARSKVVLA